MTNLVTQTHTNLMTMGNQLWPLCNTSTTFHLPRLSKDASDGRPFHTAAGSHLQHWQQKHLYSQSWVFWVSDTDPHSLNKSLTFAFYNSFSQRRDCSKRSRGSDTCCFEMELSCSFCMDERELDILLLTFFFSKRDSVEENRNWECRYHFTSATT